MEDLYTAASVLAGIKKGIATFIISSISSKQFFLLLFFFSQQQQQASFFFFSGCLGTSYVYCAKADRLSWQTGYLPACLPGFNVKPTSLEQLNEQRSQLSHECVYVSLYLQSIHTVRTYVTCSNELSQLSSQARSITLKNVEELLSGKSRSMRRNG